MTKRSTILITASLATLLVLFAPVARADIYEWEYINPANPAQGKQPSATLAPDGAGANAVPGTNLSNRNLTKAYLIGAAVSPYIGYDPDYGYVSSYVPSNLTAVNLSQADLANAYFGGASGYNWNEEYTVYPGADLTDANLFQANATNANFFFCTLTGANLSQADLTNANLLLASLTNANLSQANLTNADINNATLTGANLIGAEVRGANFSHYYYDAVGISVAQLYSTASYQAHDLTGINVSGNDMTGANFAGQNLTNAGVWATLTNANFSQANLTGATVGGPLTGANFTGAEVRGATLGGITAAQLYSTASYQAHDLIGIRLYSNDLAGVNLAGQNLTNADFAAANLTGANLSQANLTNANFVGNLCDGSDCIIAGTNFTNANLKEADARGVNFQHARLTGANFTDADVRGADFYHDADSGGTGITVAQLYSTASYQAGDLSGTSFVYNDFTGANFAGQNLTNADFDAATLTGADFTAVDARGASVYVFGPAITTNLIRPDGHIAGLNLTAGASLVVRDYDGNPGGWYQPPNGPLAIVVDQHLAMDTTGALRLMFDSDPWDSTISFAPGIPVALGGTLELTFAPGVNVATQTGRTIDLFDWTGVTPTGAFTVSSPYTWDLSKLYTTGEVTLATLSGLLGDFNNNGVVDSADYVVWRNGLGTIYTQTDYDVWRAHFGTVSPGIGAGSSAADPLSRVPASADPLSAAVPEPAGALLLLLGTLGSWRVRRISFEVLARCMRSPRRAPWRLI